MRTLKQVLAYLEWLDKMESKFRIMGINRRNVKRATEIAEELAVILNHEKRNEIMEAVLNTQLSMVLTDITAEIAWNAYKLQALK